MKDKHSRGECGKDTREEGKKERRTRERIRSIEGDEEG